MNEEIWHKMFKDYIEDFNAINKLQCHGIANDEDSAILKHKLLEEIITTMESEVDP